MKDLVITKSRQKKEILYIFLCFLFAFGANVYAIHSYNSAWMELITQLPYILIITCTLYMAFTLFRLVLMALFKILFFPFRKKTEEPSR